MSQSYTKPVTWERDAGRRYVCNQWNMRLCTVG